MAADRSAGGVAFVPPSPARPVQQQGSMGPPPPRAPQAKRLHSAAGLEVLDEDSYAEAIEAIIERDFFPDLTKLHNKMEWLQAVQSGDPAAIKRAQLNIARRRAGLKTPGPGLPAGTTPAPSTVRTFTGGTTQRRGLATPAMTPLLRADEVGGDAAAAAGAAGPAAGLAAGGSTAPRAPPLSLDAFLGRYTGEDNASFAQLQEASNARKRAKHSHHLTDKDAPLLLQGPHSTDEYGTSGQQPGTLLPWKHAPKSALYYDSSQRAIVPLSDSERASMVQGPPKEIRHTNTRMPGGTDGDPIGDAAVVAVTADAADVADVLAVAAGLTPAVGAVAAGEGGAQPGKAPGTRGYGYLRTPLLNPAGPEASPLITWGEIEATPLRLEVDDNLDLGGLGAEDGPQFRLPEVRRREAAAAAALAAKGSTARRSKLRASKTPLVDALRSRQPGTPLSGAAQRLASSLHAKGGMPVANFGSDAQLRASYSGAAGAHTPVSIRGASGASVGRTTGGAATPQVAPGSSKRAPLVMGNGGSITDDLLRI